MLAFAIGVIVAIICIYWVINNPLNLLLIYPITMLDAVQSYQILGQTPAIFLGGLIIVAALLRIRTFSGLNRSKTAVLLLLVFFLVWVLLRSSLEGLNSSVLSNGANILVVLSYIIIIRNQDQIRKAIASVVIVTVILAASQFASVIWGTLGGILKIMSQQRYILERTSGLARDPNFASTTMLIGFIFFFIKALSSPRTNSRQFLFYALMSAFMVFSIIFTLSRANLIIMAVCIVIILLLGNKSRSMGYLVFISIGFLVYYLTLGQDFINNALLKLSPNYLQADPSNISRFQTFRMGLDALAKNPLFGLGQRGAYHNAFIDISILGGMIALIMFVAIVSIVLFTNIKDLSSRIHWKRDTAEFIVVSMLSLLANGMVIPLEFEKVLWVMIAIGLTTYFIPASRPLME